MSAPPTKPIVLPTLNAPANASDVAFGTPIAPIERLKLLSPGQWEDVINEWTSSLHQYAIVDRTGGAGDMGCDVIARITAGNNSPWDNYQCKHYDHALHPGDVWLEIAKLAFYTFSGAYTVPRRYQFVAPRGVGTKLHRLLRDPDALRQGVITNWNAYCKDKITSTRSVLLDGALRNHIDLLDFSIFGYVAPLAVIEGLRTTPYFAVRFGGGLPRRPKPAAPPTAIQAVESRYIEQLLEAYGDDAGCTFANPDALTDKFRSHFDRSRESFFSAEALRNFSRDTVPPGTYDHLQDQLFDGVVDVSEAEHQSGFERVLATTDRAQTIDVSSSALYGRVEPTDRRGICHQLSNDDRLQWVPKK